MEHNHYYQNQVAFFFYLVGFSNLQHCQLCHILQYMTPTVDFHLPATATKSKNIFVKLTSQIPHHLYQL